MFLGVEESFLHLARRRGRDETPDQLHGPFVQRPRRLAIRVPFDATVRRVGRERVDPRHVEGPRVDPRPVAVPVVEEDGALGDQGVEHGSVRRAAREVVQGPTAAHDPGHIRM